MMAELKPYKFFLLRYVPNAVNGEFVNIGFILMEQGANGDGFVEVQFRKDWNRIRCIDKGADVESFRGLEQELHNKLNDPLERSEFFKKLENSLSGTVQLTSGTGCLAEDPVREMAFLNELYLETPSVPGSITTEERAPTGRRLILQTMADAFNSIGLSRLVARNIPIEDFTKRGDPFKFDFGYCIEKTSEMKWFQAVSMKTNVEAAVTLAARYPKIADIIREKAQLDSWLTAVIDDEVDRSLKNVEFALEMLGEAGIVVAKAQEMEDIAKTAALELRA